MELREWFTKKWYKRLEVQLKRGWSESGRAIGKQSEHLKLSRQETRAGVCEIIVRYRQEEEVVKKKRKYERQK